MTTTTLDRAPGSVLDDALLGAGLPTEAERHLHLAGQAYHQDDLALAHLRRAQALAPDHVAVLIGFYRFYFYKGRLAEALDIARLCLAKAAKDCGLPVDWRKLRREDAAFASYDALAPRFLLFTLRAYAYLQFRLGELEDGRQAIDKMLELDPSDKLGGRLLLDVLARKDRPDDD